MYAYLCVLWGVYYIILYYDPRPHFYFGRPVIGPYLGVGVPYSSSLPRHIASYRIVSDCAATVPTMTVVIVTLTGVAFLILIHFSSVRSLDFYL